MQCLQMAVSMADLKYVNGWGIRGGAVVTGPERAPSEPRFETWQMAFRVYKENNLRSVTTLVPIGRAIWVTAFVRFPYRYCYCSVLRLLLLFATVVNCCWNCRTSDQTL